MDTTMTKLPPQVAALRDQLADVPALVKQLANSPQYVLDVPRALAEKIASGELEFVRQRTTGAMIGTLRNSVTKEIVAQLPLTEIPTAAVTGLLETGMDAKLAQVSTQLTAIAAQLTQDTQAQWLQEQAAMVHATQELIRLAQLTQSPVNQTALYQEALTQATLVKQQCQTTLQAAQTELQTARTMRRQSDSAVEVDSQAVSAAMSSLRHLLAAIDCQLTSLAGLHEYAAVDALAMDVPHLLTRLIADDGGQLLAGQEMPQSVSALIQDALNGLTQFHTYVADNGDE